MIGRRGLAWPAAAMMCCAAAAACARASDTDSASGPVRVGVVAPAGQGPRAQVVGLGYLTAVLVRETLVSIGARGEILPRLAESWERSEEGRRWRFHLKKNVQFHDGTPFTSHAVVAALRRQLSAFSGATSIEVVDDVTFDILQARPSSFLLDGIAAVSIGTAAGTGTGPFMGSRPEGDEVKFSAFRAYHRGAPSIQEVGLKSFSDQRKAWAALMRGEVDVLYEVSPDAQEFVETESTVAVSSFVRPYTYLLGFNLNNPSFRPKAVRRALNLAVDRGEMIRTALRGHAQPTYDHLWPRHWAVDAQRSAYGPDPRAAVQLLEASGLTTLRRAGPGRMPSRLAFTCLVYEPLEKFALAIQRQLALVDVDMSVELLSAPEMGQRIVTGNFEAFLFELANARVLGYTYGFWHSQSPDSVRTGYAAADEALDRMRYAQTDEEVKAAVRDVQDVMKEDPPAIFLAYPEVARAVSRRFEIPGAEEDIFHTIPRWRPVRKAAN